MRFSFTEDQTMLRDTVRGVLARECPPEVVRKAWTEGTGRAPGAYATLAETGLLGVMLGEEAGGMGMRELDLVLPLEEAGYAALPDPLLETALVALPLLEALGTEAQKSAWLERLAGGEAVATVGLDGAPFVAHAASADLFLLARGDALYAVPREALELRDELSVDRARRVAAVTYAPSDAHLMARGERARAAIDLAFDRAALGASALLVGLARRMLDLAVAYAKDREQFGKPIGSQQAVKHRLANALIQLEFARPLVYRAAWSLTNGAPHASVHVSAAKLLASEAAWFVSKQALQVHGAIGYTIEHDLHMWMKRAWALAAAYGDAAFHRERVGAAILDDDADRALVEGF
jgi:alkylation response protein AidB-like acyl-CoA dehydrogenase